MKAKEFIPVSKPRNFVVKNQKTAGAGAHKDKKRAEKQGDVKHKQKQFEQGVAEGVDNPLKDIDPNAWHLIRGDVPVAINFPDEYRAKSFHSGHGYGRETKVLHGSQVRQNAYLKHNPGVIDYPEYSKGVAEGEGGFDIEDMVMDQYRNGNDVWEIAQYLGIGEDEVQDIIDSNEQGVAEVSRATIDRYVSKASDAHGDADFKARMSKHDPDKRSYHVDQKKTAEKRRQGISRALDRMSREGAAESDEGRFAGDTRVDISTIIDNPKLDTGSLVKVNSGNITGIGEIQKIKGDQAQVWIDSYARSFVVDLKDLTPYSKKRVGEDKIAELSSELMARYKKGAGADATAADKRGDYKQGNKRFSGIVKATKKQFANDAKGKK